METKAVDQAVNQRFDSTGTVTPICIPVVGGAAYQRLGRFIQCKGLVVNCAVIPAGSATASINPDVGRVLVVADRGPFGVAASVSDILQDINNAGGVGSTPWSGGNLNNDDRFSVLLDEEISLPGAVGTTGGPPTIYPWDQSQRMIVRKYIPIENLEMMFKASAGTIADITANAIYVVTLSQYTLSSSTTAFSLVGFCRLYYCE